MTTAELDAFLRTELPQMFNYDDLTIEYADGQSCRVRQRYRENMLRPGGSISGPTLMTLADCTMFVVLLSAIGPVGLAVTTNLNINFLREAACGRGGQFAVGDGTRSNCPCHRDLFHSKRLTF